MLKLGWIPTLKRKLNDDKTEAAMVFGTVAHQVSLPSDQMARPKFSKEYSATTAELAQ